MLKAKIEKVKDLDSYKIYILEDDQVKDIIIVDMVEVRIKK